MKSAFSRNIEFMGMIRNRRSLVVFLTLITLNIAGQQPGAGQKTRREVPPVKERLFFGGSLGLQFGTFTDIEVAPIIGLWVLPRLGIAVGPNFRYYKDPLDNTLIYGGRTYAEFIFLQDFNNVIPIGLHLGLFLHVEDEALSLESSFFRNPYSSGRFLINTVLAGGGIRQPLGQRSSLNFTFLWALNNSDYGVYGDPEIRISVIF